jgi:hypothetical protein
MLNRRAARDVHGGRFGNQTLKIRKQYGIFHYVEGDQ